MSSHQERVVIRGLPASQAYRTRDLYLVLASLTTQWAGCRSEHSNLVNFLFRLLVSDHAVPKLPYVLEVLEASLPTPLSLRSTIINAAAKARDRGLKWVEKISSVVHVKSNYL